MTASTSSDDSHHYPIVEKALRLIQQQHGHQPSLAEVAKHCGLSDYHLQQVFKQWAGVSPEAFLRHLTREQAQLRLLTGHNLLQASSGNGLATNVRQHKLLVKLQAASPRELKSYGQGIQFDCGLHSSPFGYCFIANTQQGIHHLGFSDGRQIQPFLDTLQQQWPKAVLTHNQQTTAPLVQELFQHSATGPTLQLWLRGSPFQLKVWEASLRIPSGSLCSYSAIAESIDQPLAARAVGSALAKNTVALLIPCHRVIPQSGGLGHYRWDEIRKQALIGWEASKNN